MATREKGLTYPYALDEQGNMILAEGISKEDRLNHEYYIEGLLEDGTIGKEKVIVVIGDKRRHHFRRYRKESKEYTGPRVYITKKSYNETVIHRVAKQLFSEGKIKEISLPAVFVRLPGQSIKVKEEDTFKISRCELEVTEKKVVRYDVVAYNDLKESLAIELYVTHKTDAEKREKVRQLGKNTLEIDLSDLVQEDKIVTNDIEDKIKDRITCGGQTSSPKQHIWINHKEENRIHSWFNSLVDQQLIPTKYKQERDGRWYFWAADAKGRLIKCPYYDRLDPLGKSVDRMLTERRCKECDRCVSIEYSPVEGRGKLICNQSDVPNTEMLRLLASYGVGVSV